MNSVLLFGSDDGGMIARGRRTIFCFEREYVVV